jgi:hypothetical protein
MLTYPILMGMCFRYRVQHLTIGAPEKGKHLKELPAEASSRWKTSNDALSEYAAEGAQGALAIEAGHSGE